MDCKWPQEKVWDVEDSAILGTVESNVVDIGMKWTVDFAEQPEGNIVGSAMVCVVDCRLEWSCAESRMSRTVECQLMQ